MKHLGSVGLRFRLRLSLNLKGWMAIRRQNSCKRNLRYFENTCLQLRAMRGLPTSTDGNVSLENMHRVATVDPGEIAVRFELSLRTNQCMNRKDREVPIWFHFLDFSVDNDYLICVMNNES